MISLSNAEVGKTYKILKITAQEPIKSRLASMGFARDNTVSVIKYTLSKQTYDVKIEQTDVALRQEEATTVIVEALK